MITARVVSENRRRALCAVALLLAFAPRGAAQSRSGDARSSASGLDTARLREAVRRIASQSQGSLGVGIELLESGDRLIVSAGIRHPMQSVYKAPIAMAVLRAVDNHRLDLANQVDVRPSDFISASQHSPIRDANPGGTRVSLRELLRLAVSESDGTASDVLMRLIGGPPRVMAYLKEIGVHDVEVITTEKTMGLREQAQFENWTTPSGSLEFLRAVNGHRALSDSSRAILLALMTGSTRGLVRIPGQLPAGTPVAHKPGASGTTDGVTAATNDIGIITLPSGCHLAVAVFLTNSRLGDAARDEIIARVARAAWDFWTNPAVVVGRRIRCQ